MLKPKAAAPAYPPPHFVAVGDYRIAYFTAGPRDGRPLVLCHGLAASGLQFALDSRFFAQHGFRVIVPDLRGHGRSTGPREYRHEDFSIARLAKDMIAVLDDASVAQTDWVGNSLGGILALSLMGSAPDRLNRFISFGTAFALDVPKVVVPFMQLGHKIMGLELLARLGAPMTCRGEKGQAVIYEMLRTLDAEAIIHIARHVERYNLTANAQNFDGPMLMIRGDLDKAVNLALKSTLEAMQTRDNFTLVDTKNAGHCANLDQPDNVRNTILDFLN